LSKIKAPDNKGGNFFALDPTVWEQLWEVETVNRLNLITVYLVLSAGTGRDHRLTKWSTKACERHAGLGKPRAKIAIDELIQLKLIQHTERSTKAFPQYELQSISSQVEPIFLPVAAITGLKEEASILRRVRETGDAILLRMLIDMYGLIQLDATFGMPIKTLSERSSEDYPTRKILEIGVNTIWALRLGGVKHADPNWAMKYCSVHQKKHNWEEFWERIRMLEHIGALWYEPWIFDSNAMDAEPLFPINMGGSRDNSDAEKITTLLRDVAEELSKNRYGFLENYGDDVIVTLSSHRQPPSIKGVARLVIESDTSGRRYSYYARQENIRSYEIGYSTLKKYAIQGDFSHPMNTAVKL